MENGSIVHIDYDLYNADDDVLIETTREAVAKEAEQHDENRTYTPLITVIGAGTLIAGFESHLAEADAETDYEFDIAPEEAYGERDPNAVETMGQDVLARSVRDPESLAIGGVEGTDTVSAAGKERHASQSQHVALFDCLTPEYPSTVARHRGHLV